MGIKDEHKRQNRRSNVVGKALDTGTDRITAGYTGRGKGRQPHRWCVVRQDAEVEYKQMHRNERHDQTALRAQIDNHRRHQGGDHNVVGRGRQSHTEKQADDGGEEQDQH